MNQELFITFIFRSCFLDVRYTKRLANLKDSMISSVKKEGIMK
jgi:hypothetical protein